MLLLGVPGEVVWGCVGLCGVMGITFTIHFLLIPVLPINFLLIHLLHHSFAPILLIIIYIRTVMTRCLER